MNHEEIEHRLDQLDSKVAEIKDILNMQIKHNSDLTERRFRDTVKIVQNIGGPSGEDLSGAFPPARFSWDTAQSQDFGA